MKRLITELADRPGFEVSDSRPHGLMGPIAFRPMSWGWEPVVSVDI
jgi:hypothetical protein